MMTGLKVYWDYEDKLEVYKITDGMFKASKIINGVRMYPYVILGDGRKFYLEYQYTLIFTRYHLKFNDIMQFLKKGCDLYENIFNSNC